MVFFAGLLNICSESVWADEPYTTFDLDTQLEVESEIVRLNSSELTVASNSSGNLRVTGDGGDSLSLSRLEELALAYNPTIQQAAANLEKAKGIHTQVGLRPNPIFGYQAAEVGNEGRSGQQGVFLGQEFVTAGKLGLNRDIAYQDIERSRWIYQTQEYRVLNDVRSSFYRLLGARAKVQLLDQLLSLAQANLDAAQALANAGQGTRPQALQATVEVQNNRVALQNARNHQEAMWRQLTAVVGVPTLSRERIEGDLTQTAPILDWNSTWEWAQSNSPEVQSAARAVGRARFAIERARVEPIPNIEAQVGVQYDASTHDTVTGLQIGIPIPVNNRNQGNIRAAQGELIRASRDIERVQLSLRHRLASSFKMYSNAQQQVTAYHDEVLPTAKETLELVTEGYKSGELDYLQLVTTQRTYFQTGLTYVNAQTNLWLSVVAIEGLVLSGGLNEPGSSEGAIDAPDINSTYPLGLFPMMQP